MSNGISGVGGFGTYTIFNSALQYLLGFGKRRDAEEQQKINEDFEIQLIKAKEAFSDEMESAKLAMTRAKLQIARQYKAIETQDRLCLSQKRPQLIKFLKEDLPIDPTLLKSLIIQAEKCSEAETRGVIPPINVLLLYPIREIDRPFVNASLEDYFNELGNIKFLPWTTKLAGGNTALFNLNVIMRDMPTLVVSSRYVEEEKKLYISAALWDRNTERQPYIRPLFKLDFDHTLLFPKEGEKGISLIGKKELGNKIIFATTLIAGCARDAFMLMNYGLEPTLPEIIAKNEWLKNRLLEPDAEVIRDFLVNEYQSNCASLQSKQYETTEYNNDIEELSKLADDSLSRIKNILQLQIPD